MVRRLHISLLGLFAFALLSGAPSGQTGTASPPAAGATITGRIVDAARSARPGVAVTLEQNGQATQSAVTDKDGRFRFTGVRPGAYQLRAVLAGFTTVNREVVVHTAADTLHHAIVLTRDPAAAGAATKNAAEAANRQADMSRDSQGMPVHVPSSEGDAAARTAAGGQGRGGSVQGGVAAVPPPVNVYPAAGPMEAPAWIRPEPPPYGTSFDAERYANVRSHRFQRTLDAPLSTFGADVDTASYANVRRFLSNGQLPPEAAVRVEEFVNYFRFPYAAPRSGAPIALTTEIGDAPWAPGHKLVLIGAPLRGAAYGKRK